MAHSVQAAAAVVATLLLLVVLAQAAPTQVRTLGIREQCGGLLESGERRQGSGVDAVYEDVTCADALKCERKSKWYWECVPSATGGAAGANFAWQLEKALTAGSGSGSSDAMVEMLNASDDGELLEESEPASKPAAEGKQQLAQAAEPKGSEQKGVFVHRAFALDAQAASSSVVQALKKLPQIVKPTRVSQVVHDLFKRRTLERQEHLVVESMRRLANTQGLWNGPSTNPPSSDNAAKLYAALGIKPGMIGQWQQCGGRINAPSKKDATDGQWADAECWPGWSCKRVNEYYRQCSPDRNVGQNQGSNPPAFIEQSGVRKEILDVWAQCGGKGGQIPKDEKPVDGPYPTKTCFADTCCTRQNEWYWQCLPYKGGCSGDFGPSSSPSSPILPPVYSSPSPAAYPSPAVYGSPQPSSYSPSPYLPTYEGSSPDPPYANYSPPP